MTIDFRFVCRFYSTNETIKKINYFVFLAEEHFALAFFAEQECLAEHFAFSSFAVVAEQVFLAEQPAFSTLTSSFVFSAKNTTRR